MPELTLWSLIGWSLIGAVTAALGAWIAIRRGTGEGRFLGLAGASSAGIMLGVGYTSLMAGMGQAPMSALLGGALGVVAGRLLDAAPKGESVTPDADGASASAATAASGLHSAAEGLAIGAAAVVDPWFGLFLIATFALHNISEGAVLGAALTAGGWGTERTVTLTFVARLAQPALAAVAFLIARNVPFTLPWLLGASFGGMLYLIVAEMLPLSYRQAGRTGIALIFSFAAGIVALFGGRVH